MLYHCLSCSKCGGSGCNKCSREVITKKGEKGDTGPKGADGVSYLILKESSERTLLSPTSTNAEGDGLIEAMVQDGSFYIDVSEGDWVLEFAGMLGSDSLTSNELFRYQIFEDSDSSSESADSSGDTALTVSERSELIHESNNEDEHSLYTTAYVSIPEGETRRYKVYYGYADNEAAKPEYYVNYLTLRAVKFQNVNLQ